MSRAVSPDWVITAMHTVTVRNGVPEGDPSNGAIVDPHQAATDDYLAWLATANPDGPWTDLVCALNFASVASCIEIFVDPENIAAWMATEPPALDALLG